MPPGGDATGPRVRHRTPMPAAAALSLHRAVVCVVVVGAGVAGCARPDGSVPDDVFGHCIYVNRFSQLEECREFRGTGWTEEDAQASCDEYDVEFVAGACAYDAVQGACVTSSDAERAVQLVIPGDDPSSCADNQRGCELFGGGTWVDGATCGEGNGVDVDDAYDADNYYVPATQTCNEVDGASVCTWNQMSGCTQEGLRFEDQGSCETVLTQRPYYPVPADTANPLDDPRLDDPTYAAELSWVKGQLEACACVCCHKASVSPEGPAVWDTDAAGNFINTFSDWGIGFGARAFDSSLLGSYDAADNNGFSRFVAGLPSTDEPRMKRFFEGELAHRGLTVADFADEPPAPSVFADQADYVPVDCADGEGVDDDGVVRWQGGRARYLYVLAEGSVNPGVPPNLDVPEGTLWRIDTVPPAVPAKTGEVVYGVLPEGHREEVPPTPLVVGERYVVYALADIGVPITRCVFER